MARVLPLKKIVGSDFDQLRNIPRDTNRAFWKLDALNKETSPEKQVSLLSEALDELDNISERDNTVIVSCINRLKVVRSKLTSTKNGLRKQKNEIKRKIRRSDKEEKELYRKQLEFLDKRAEHLANLIKSVNSALRRARDNASLSAKEEKKIKDMAA